MKIGPTTMRRSAMSCAAIAGLAAASLCGSAHAVQLWYDGFSLADGGGDYVVGESGTPELAGQTGGSGSFFAGPWAAADYPAAPDNAKVFSTGLSRPGLTVPTIGGSSSDITLFDCCTETRTSRLLASPWAGPTNPDGTFYISYLMNFGPGNAEDPHHRVLEMHEGGFDDGLNRNLMLGFSSFVPGFPADRTLTLAVRDSNDPEQDTFFQPLAEAADLDDINVQGTHLLVLKFELSNSGNDTISAFLDPVGAVEPTPSASITVGEFLADRISSMVQFSYTGPGQNGYFDEIRVGTEFADVAINTLAYRGVPEPATLSLLGLGMAGLISMTRRRSV